VMHHQFNIQQLYALPTLYLCVLYLSEIEFDSEKEIKPNTECTYLGTKIDLTGDNTTEIRHRINQTRKTLNALNSIWWHKDITKNRKLYIYYTIIQSI
jgi:hypothetical protein